MSELQVNPDDPGTDHRPGDDLTFVVADLDTARAVVTDLGARGVDTSHVVVLEGDRGAAAFDRDPGRTQGWFARLLASLDAPGGRDADVVQAYRDALHDGLVVLRVPLGSGDDDAVVSAVQAHGARSIVHITSGSMENIPSMR